MMPHSLLTRVLAGIGLIVALALPALAQGVREINAGPIWNQPDAQQKCPRVCGQAGGQWNGHWRTTQFGQMSVCNCQMPMTGASQGSGQWSLCARENEPCYLPYPTTVAYGANGVFARKRFTRAGNIDCSNRTFGDPLVGVGKSCHFQVMRNAPPPPPPVMRTQWSRCASENEPCYIPYPTTVAYGANGVWTQRRFNRPGNIDCSNRTFGDPLPGVVKGCQFRVER